MLKSILNIPVKVPSIFQQLMNATYIPSGFLHFPSFPEFNDFYTSPNTGNIFGARVPPFTKIDRQSIFQTISNHRKHVAEMKYKNGMMLKKNKARSTKFLLEAAAYGHSQAQLELYYNNPNSSTLKYLSASACNGNIKAMEELALHYMFNTNNQQRKGFRLIKKVADKGRLSAMHFYGIALLSGTNFRSPVIPDLGHKYLHRAAEGNHIPSIKLLGNLHYYGLHGLPEDKSIGLKYISKGADLGESDCKKFLEELPESEKKQFNIQYEEKIQQIPEIPSPDQKHLTAEVIPKNAKKKMKRISKSNDSKLEKNIV